MDRLKGKVAIITGGNSGVGEATAKMFAKEGATVVITARREAALEKVAEAVNLNPVYLSNIFRKETNEKFVDYVHKRKIEAAKQMLRSEDTSVVKIAEALGYFDSKYFSKIFRKYVGIKPTDYRNIYGYREK